ncbi:hypothetical protein [Mucilaginibacter gilvus]|uniref:Lipocalin-like domain-containing protein n=1 Tax=Mucilaginibacter gilvus TaxID=2305909 RepID=A0A3S3V015_9SPHI|nr:hypothetical protein [Mucilaginibacter gilvus]RWY52290.1 hypothetical protein EPL05_10250 [Mucilaginibacter gilvus]
MKKLFFLMSTTVIILTASCSKSSSDPTPTGDNTWTLGGTKHTVTFTNKGLTSGGTPSTLIIFADKIPVGADPAVNTLNLSFKTSPTASGKYTLIGLGSTPTDKQFQLSAGGNGKAYGYIGVDTDVDITITGGKVKVTIPEVLLKSTTSGNPDQKITATIFEIN